MRDQKQNEQKQKQQALHEKVNQSEKRIGDLVNKIGPLNAKNSQLELEVIECDKEMHMLREDIWGLDQEAEGYDSQNKKLQSALDELHEKNLDLMRQIEDGGKVLSPSNTEGHAEVMNKIANLTPPKLESIYNFAATLANRGSVNSSMLVATDRIPGVTPNEISTTYDADDFLSSTNEFHRNFPRTDDLNGREN